MSMTDIVNEIRLELTDEQVTRWETPQLMQLINKAVRRLNQILVRNEINFARQVQDVTFLPDGTIGQFPIYSEILSISGLFRDSDKLPVIQLWPIQWARLQSAPTMSYWAVVNGVAQYRGVTAVTPAPTGKLVYFPKVEIDPVNSPWEGRLDDIIAEYAAFRAKNIDEMNLQQDRELLGELEDRIIDNYKTLEQQHEYASGWNN